MLYGSMLLYLAFEIVANAPTKEDSLYFLGSFEHRIISFLHLLSILGGNLQNDLDLLVQFLVDL